MYTDKDRQTETNRQINRLTKREREKGREKVGYQLSPHRDA